MHWMKFTLELVELLIWPVLVLLILGYFRKPLTSILPMLRRLRFREIEMEFDRQLQETKQATDKFLLKDNTLRSRLLQTSIQDPNAAVLEAWKAIERIAKEIITNNQGDVDWDTDSPYKHLEDILTHENLVDKNTAQVFSDLRQLRNKVSHAPGFELSAIEAVQYIELCDQLIHHLNHL